LLEGNTSFGRGKRQGLHALNEALSSPCTAIHGIRRERVRKAERVGKRREKRKESFRLYSKETRNNGR
jgi:hypothetical protein